MTRRLPGGVLSSEITPYSIFLKRREFVAGALSAGLIGSVTPLPLQAANLSDTVDFPDVVKSPFSADEPLTPLKDITSINNFIEFGSGKEDPAARAHVLTTKPWTVKIDGMVKHGAGYDLDDLIKTSELEERIYRFRCVEGWSMVIPWIGVPLASILKRVEPEGSAKYVRFETLYRPEEMRGQQRGMFQAIQYPYVEALRLDEAMNPLTILAVGLYGKTMPKQNGAPVRLIVPWKYGYKSIKSVTRITLTEKRPDTSWNLKVPREYGFFGNVNPEVDHPRWSQAKERRLGESGFFMKQRPTLMFNGYAEEVASLYAGMDLEKNY